MSSPSLRSAEHAIARVPMNRIAGAFSLASSNLERISASVSPCLLFITSGPAMCTKCDPVSFAIAFAINVLPQPGGPNMSTPFGGDTPMAL